MDPSWPMQGPFDVIFCRNVVIYFDDVTTRGLVQRYRQLLGEGGHLILGHSESMVASSTGFESCGRTIYRRSGR
jgi:chemotaxis protein methyltransferase CheR